MEKKPYVGVTGFIHRKDEELESEHVVRWWEHLPKKGRVLSLGILVASQTLARRQNWPRRYPHIEDVEKILIDHPDVINIIHYFSAIPDSLYSQLGYMAGKFDDRIQGFQINHPWPAILELERFREVYDGKYRLIMTLGRDELGQLNFDPSKLCLKLYDYLDLIDDVLIDFSQSEGKVIRPEETMLFLHALDKMQDKISLGVAGGFCPETIHLLKLIRDKFPNISSDAESQLRTTEDYLHLDRTCSYLSLHQEIIK